jgi:hypothetical protein
MMDDQRFAVPDHVVARELGGEMVLLDLEHGTYFGLDAVGARVWQLVTEGHSLKATCTAMLRDYAVAAEVLEGDVRELLATLVDKDLLRSDG